MITSKDVRNKRFEKAAFGYQAEAIDEFLSQLEAELEEMERERAEANNKIQILADKVREYMKDEDALKDALLMAQKQGHQVINDAKEKAEQIIGEAKAKAAVLEDEAVRQHAEAMEKNRLEIAKEKENLVDAQKKVADFKKSLFEMYKSHLEMISTIPEEFEDDENSEKESRHDETAEEIAAAILAAENFSLDPEPSSPIIDSAEDALVKLAGTPAED